MTYRIAVRELCEFTAKQGDLDLRFTPAPTALEGIAGHQRVAARRGEAYESEVSLAGVYQVLEVRGRADGYDAAANRLEEVKTYRGDLAHQAGNQRALHWAQLKVYGWLLCQQRALPTVTLRLVYFDIGSERETHFDECLDAESLRQFFIVQCEAFLTWAKQEQEHRAARDEALERLRFPFDDFRSGQRTLAEGVYKAAKVGCCLTIEAPTGIGKTLGTLFPQLKAMPQVAADRLFFLAAKTPGRGLALKALQHLHQRTEAMPLRVLELVARDKACEHPDAACHGEACPLARGFYDRLPAARREAASRRWLERGALQELARHHAVCPYYLGQEMARWADVVVGDYNYYFDMSAFLHALAQANRWKTLVLVDEAHNLVDRGRGMYSAALDQQALSQAKRDAPAALSKTLDRLLRQWRALNAAQEGEYASYPQPPERFLQTLQQIIGGLSDYLAERPVGLPSSVQRFYLEALHFSRVAELFGPHYLFDIEKGAMRGSGSRLCLRNLLPAPFLAPRFETAHSCVLFSATFSPRRYYADLLGLPRSAAVLDVGSPFAAEQLTVRVASHVSTRFRDRAGSLEAIVELMASHYGTRPGNYLAFFSSFDYLDQVAERFAARFPQVPQWQQHRQMSEAERQAFLAHFDAAGAGIGFAVLGGAFGEGIDLPGDRLIGAFIATLGLPQVNPVNEQLRERLQSLFGAGYDYAYFYPGLQKVVQAAGRVIRTVEDQGTIVLIDDRFATSRVRELLPQWWPAPVTIGRPTGADGSRQAEIAFI